MVGFAVCLLHNHTRIAMRKRCFFVPQTCVEQQQHLCITLAQHIELVLKHLHVIVAIVDDDDGFVLRVICLFLVLCHQ